MIDTFIILVSVLVGIGRTAVPGHDLSWAGTYEAFAHIWVGMLIAWCFQKGKEKRAMPISALVVLTVFEAAMFMAR